MVYFLRLCVLILCLLPFTVFQNCAPSASRSFTTETKSDTKIPESRIPDPRLWSNGDGYGKPTVFVRTSSVCSSGISDKIEYENLAYKQTIADCLPAPARDISGQVQVTVQNPNVIIYNGEFYEQEETAAVHPVEVFCRGTGTSSSGNSNKPSMGTVDVAMSYNGVTDSMGQRHYSGYVISNYLNDETGVIDTEYVIIDDATASNVSSPIRTYRFVTGFLYRLANSEQSAASLSSLPSGGGIRVDLASQFGTNYSLSQTNSTSGNVLFHNYSVGTDFQVTAQCYSGEIEGLLPGGSTSGGSTSGGSTSGGSTSGGSTSGGSTSGGSTSGGSTSGGSTSGGSTSGGSTSGGSTSGGSTSGGSTSGGSTSGGTVTTSSARQMVVAAYKSIFGRTQAEIDVDTAGVNYWVNRILAGLTKSQLDSALYASDEYYVRGLYSSIFKRRGDLAGVQYWEAQLKSKAKTRAQVKADFEYTCKNKLGECL